MSRRSESLSRCLADLEAVLLKISTGRADRPVVLAKVDFAAQNLDNWVSTQTPSSNVGPERGGSSSPREAEDRIESMRLSIQVMRDMERLPEIAKTMERLGSELYMLVARNTELIDHSKLPKESDVLPGCVSCARPQDRRRSDSGHFSPVADPDPHGERRWGKELAVSVGLLGLCSFCRAHAVDSAKAQGRDRVVPSRDYPPLKAVDVLCLQGEQAAGRWLTKQQRGAA